MQHCYSISKLADTKSSVVSTQSSKGCKQHMELETIMEILATSKWHTTTCSLRYSWGPSQGYQNPSSSHHKLQTRLLTLSGPAAHKTQSGKQWRRHQTRWNPTSSIIVKEIFPFLPNLTLLTYLVWFQGHGFQENVWKTILIASCSVPVQANNTSLTIIIVIDS